MKKRMAPVMLLVFNLLVFSILCVWIKRDVEAHVDDDTDLKTAWRYVREIGYESLEQDTEFAFQPQSYYLHHIECILINLPENARGNLVAEIYTGENASGKRVAKTIVPLTGIAAGEWQSIPLEVWLSPSKKYYMRIGVSEAEEIPYLIYTDREFTVIEHEGVQPTEYERQPVIAYCYGAQISWVIIVTVLLTMICVNVSIICKLIKKDEKRYALQIMGGNTVPELVCWISLLILFSFLHFYRLADVPVGINVDEMGMGYDAWALSHFGVDRWGVSFPVYLENHANGQSILYCLLCMPFIHFLGITEVAMRMPGVLASFITLFFGGRLIWRKYSNKKLLFLFVTLMTISPYFIYSARLGLDCNLFLMVSALFIWFFEKARCERKVNQWIAVGIIGGVMLYSYALSWIVLPIFIVLSLGWLFWIKRLRLAELLAMGIPLAVLALPLLLFNVVNQFGWDSIHFCGITIPSITNYRSGMLLKNAEGYGVIEKIVTLFRALFVNSGDVYPVVMPLYWISIPFFFIGMWHYYTLLVAAAKKKQYTSECTMLFWLAAQCVMGVCIDTPVTYRMNGIFLVILFMIIEGMRKAFDSVWDGKKIILFCTAIIYFVCFIDFGKGYLTGGIQRLRPFAYYSLDEVNQKALEEITQKETGTPVYIYTNDNWFSYVYYLAANHITPEEFAEGGASRISWKNVHFDFPKEVIDQGAIYVIMEGLEDTVDKLYGLGMHVKKLDHYYIVWQR